MLIARIVMRKRVTTSALAEFLEGFSFVFIPGCLMLFADDNFGGLDVLADTGASWNGPGGFPRQTYNFDVFRPVAGGDGILVPRAGHGVSLKDVESDQSTTGNQHPRGAVASSAHKLFQHWVEPIRNRTAIPIDNAETVALDVSDQLGLPDLLRQRVHGRAIDFIQLAIIGQGSKAASADKIKRAHGCRGHAEQPGGDQHFEERKAPFEFLPQLNTHNSESRLSRYR